MSRGTTGTCASVVNKSRKFLPVVDADLSKLQSSNTPKYEKSLRDRNIFLKTESVEFEYNYYDYCILH